LLGPSTTVRAAGVRGGAVPLLVAARLAGVRAHYGSASGAGLSALVSALAPAVDRSLHAALTDATAAVAALPERPSGTGVSSAAEACHAVELALKTGVTAALGVTLTLQSADGD
jgi:hypothetical protein